MACGAPGQEMKANEQVQTIVNEVCLELITVASASAWHT